MRPLATSDVVHLRISAAVHGNRLLTCNMMAVRGSVNASTFSSRASIHLHAGVSSPTAMDTNTDVVRLQFRARFADATASFSWARTALVCRRRTHRLLATTRRSPSRPDMEGVRLSWCERVDYNHWLGAAIPHVKIQQNVKVHVHVFSSNITKGNIRRVKLKFRQNLKKEMRALAKKGNPSTYQKGKHEYLPKREI
jgi:hypothetical protein